MNKIKIARKIEIIKNEPYRNSGDKKKTTQQLK